MRSTTWGLTMMLAAMAAPFITSSTAEAKHEQLSAYSAVQADYRTTSGERIPICRNEGSKKPVRWWVTNAKGEIMISGQQAKTPRCLQ
jgi:hypothetical protein